ncbi:hypothetical protein R1flu_024111 [Riccia fluitans]|uniref:Late embryogenesis abundant protein n=1 Tax=Riccia fluitans TaxID=41844 RepID=A0ABD1XUE6_9MARC
MNSGVLLSSVQLLRMPAVRPLLLTGSFKFLSQAPLGGGGGGGGYRLALVASSSGTASSSSSRRTVEEEEEEEGEIPDMAGKQETPQPGAEREGYREDMAESYGVAYAIRSSDEGYGEIYGEAVKRYQTNPDVKEVQRGMTAERDQNADAVGGTKSGQEYDKSQGHPVAEKEDARHAEGKDAFQSTTPTMQSGGGAAT